MSEPLTLFHDYTSPASAVAVARLQRLADEGLAVEFEGFEMIGVDVGVPLTLDTVAQMEALAGVASAEGLTLRRPAELPPTGLAHVLGTVADQRGLGASWRQVAYAAFWTEAVDLGDRAVLTGLALRAGLPADEVSIALDDRLFLAAVRRRMTGRRREGVGGVPTILSQRTLVPGLLSETDLRELVKL